MTAAAADPAKLIATGAKFMTDTMALWQAFLTGTPAASPVAAIKDKRFAGSGWETPLFDFLRQSYLLASNAVLTTTAEADLDPAAKAKALFAARQFVDALSPANFPLTNPEVLAATRDSGGENLLKGLEHMLADLERGRMRMTDEGAFAVGRDVAATPGKVVFENRLFQLIQYTATTDTVFATPLLIYPPWINKFYILDLTAEKSLIGWAVAQGLTVFVVSWKNADATIADATLDTYVAEGQLTALAEVLRRTGEPSAHVIGYCVAGTVLAATLALLEAKGQADKVASRDLLHRADRLRRRRRPQGLHRRRRHRRGREERDRRHHRRPGAGGDVQHAPPERPDLGLCRQQLPAGEGLFPVRPALLELGCDQRPGVLAPRLSAATCTATTGWCSPAGSPSPACRSTCGRSRRRPISSRAATTTSRRRSRSTR